MQSVIERIVDNSVWAGECLVWQGGGPRGYGVVYNPDIKAPVYVHRFIYEHTVGPIPSGREIDHVAERGCRFRGCVNPDHLEPVTHAENRKRARLTVCRAGRHDLTDDRNVTWDRDGNRRGCAACKREKALARYYATKDLPNLGGQ